MSSFDINTKTLITGASNSGKTSLMKWIMYHLQNKFRFCIVVSATADARMEYQGHVPDTFIYTKHPSKIIKKLLAKQTILVRLKKMKDPRVENMNINVLLILDGVLFGNRWKTDESIRDLMFNGLHLSITTFIIQDQIELPPAFRAQIDYIFAFRMQSEEEKEKIYKHYWYNANGVFLGAMNKCTDEAYKCLVIHNYHNYETFYCKTKHPNEIPDFKIGEPEIWELHDKEYDQDWWNIETE